MLLYKIAPLYFLLLFAQAKAQNTLGIPEIVNYTRQDYNAGTQNWNIAQDSRGILYVANTEGILTFDGNFWRKYKTSTGSTVRSLAMAKEDRVYVGSQGEIGYFETGAQGELQYHSLNPLIPKDQQDFTDVWNTVVLGDAVYFRSYKRIFEYKNGRITVFPEISWGYLGECRGKLIADAYAKGLLVYDNNNWVPLVTNDSLPERAQVAGVLPLNNDSSLLITKKHGTYIIRGNQLLKYSTPDLQQLSELNPYGATYIDADRMAIVTSMGGCFILNKKGKILQRLAKLDGLQNNNILSVFVDQEKNLWLGLDNGIDFVAYNNAIRHIYPDYQEQSGGKSAIVYKDHLYIGTANGLYKASLDSFRDLSSVKSSFDAVPNTKGQVWNLSEINGQLCMGHNDGFFVMQGDHLQVVDGSSGFWLFQPLQNTMPSSVIVAGTYNGINVYHYNTGAFKNAAIHCHFESARYLAIENNIAWAAHPNKGLYKIQMNNGVQPTYSVYPDKNGILSQNQNHIFKIKSRIIFTSEKGIFEYDFKKDDFVPCVYLREFFKNGTVEYLKEDKEGNIWFVQDKRLGVVDYSSGKPVLIHFPELNNKIMSEGFEYVYPYDRNNILVAGEEGFYHINYQQYRTFRKNVPILISSVYINNKRDSLLYGGRLYSSSQPGLPGMVKPEINYNWNSFHFEYASPLYSKQPSIEYSYYLEGLDKGWSPWSRKQEKSYSYLSPGAYTFKVRARTQEGVESSVVSYSFTVLPPWYRSWPAYLLYALLLGGLGYLGYRLQHRKFLMQQHRHDEERSRLEYLNALQREIFEEEQKQLRTLHELEIERSEKEIIRLRNEKLESEIQIKNVELASTTMNLIQKGEILVKVKEEFEKMKKVSVVDKESEDYKKILKMLGDDKMKKNWEQFAVHFDKVHSDFLVSIKEAYPQLTPSELKLCAYLRLSLSSKEIAQIMNITIKSVELGRHRLRKKLGIDPSVNLFNFLLNFHSAIPEIHPIKSEVRPHHT